MSDGVKLCHRCEHRVLCIETKGEHQPRCECGMLETATYTCYMYAPVKPVVTETASGDNRPAKGPWMLSARESGCRVITEDDAVQVIELTADDKLLAYWLPKKVLVELDKARNRKEKKRVTKPQTKKRRK